jgi:hypothetical protein
MQKNLNIFEVLEMKTAVVYNDALVHGGPHHDFRFSSP